ncbi:MAG: Glycogen synthase, ADP-glucose transglucosylase [Ktedonobacterales bacterium]|jgi:starch synthase|nr:MAG: Glycogen synthase, ADP-glucose transglucosylase [Ktedonobacterales bacterium]
MSRISPGDPPSTLPSYPTASRLPLNGLPAILAAPEDEIAPGAAPLDVEAALRGKPLRVLFVASEGVPFAKTGGLADVIGALPHALRRMGHDVRVALPRYKSIDAERWHLRPLIPELRVPMDSVFETVSVLESPPIGDVPFYFVDTEHYFQREKLYGYPDEGERFILFCRAALELTRALDWQPDILHCHDWHTAIIPNWTKTIYRDDPHFAQTATVYTIHNLAYQGIFGYRILEVAGVAEGGFVYPELPELANVVDLMGRGILFADVVSTVSPRYAREILTPEYGERLHPILRERKDRLYGILNGIDTQEYDPATDARIAANYDAFSLEKRPANKRTLQEHSGLPVSAQTPIVAIISRLSDQKGFDLLDQIAVPLLEQGIQLVVSGTGDQHYHSMFQRLAARYPRQVSVHLTFNVEMSQSIYAGSDMLLMPSRFEPCGLTQMLAMRYGSIPIVHSTGGLADTVQDFDPAENTGNGFSFARYDPFQFFAAVVRALEVFQFPEIWSDLMQRAMLADYSWDASAEQYVALYRRAQELQRITAERATPREAAAQ